MSDERTGETRRCPHHAEPVADCVTCYFAASSPPVEADADLWGLVTRLRELLKQLQDGDDGSTYPPRDFGQRVYAEMDATLHRMESLLRACRAKEGA